MRSGLLGNVKDGAGRTVSREGDIRRRDERPDHVNRRGKRSVWNDGLHSAAATNAQSRTLSVRTFIGQRGACFRGHEGKRAGGVEQKQGHDSNQERA